MIRLLLRLLFLWFIIRSLLRLWRGIAQGLQGPVKPQAPTAPEAPRAVPLARDPVCGTYVVPSRAFSAGSGPDLQFFCSEACRRAYAMKIAQ